MKFKADIICANTHTLLETVDIKADGLLTALAEALDYLEIHWSDAYIGRVYEW
jgi:hypothetical protein